jgi:hypothetical protein
MNFTLQDDANVALIIGGICGAISVLLLFRELRENNKLTRAANTQALVELSAPFYMGLIQDRQMAELYLQGGKGTDGMDEVDRYRYKSLVVWWLVFHENVYYQWRNGLLDHHSYKPWSVDLRVFVRQQDIGRNWDEMSHLFQDEFANHVSRIIEETPRPPAERATATSQR